MTPIDKLSDIRKMPRLGKIRLGVKVEPEEKNPYPQATDYFVVPDEIKEYTGDRPTKLAIMFPTEHQEEFAPQYLKCYSFSQGLICRGDGMMCWRKVDTASGDFANHLTEEWVKKDGLTCEPEQCPMYASDKPQCRRVMNLLFLMPDVPGLGVWQLDTSSFYSIVNVNSCLDLIKRLCGRISFIPLTLSLEPQVVEPPGIKKKTVHILYVRSDVKLAEIQKLGRRKPEQVLLPPIDDEEAPEDLYPGGVLKEAEESRAAEKAPPAAQVPPTAQVPPQLVKTAADITAADIQDNSALYGLSEYFWGWNTARVVKFLGYSNQQDYEEQQMDPYEAFCVIKDAMAEPPTDEEEAGGGPPPEEEEPDAEPEGGEEVSEQAGAGGGVGGAAQRTSTVPKGEKIEKSRGGPPAAGGAAEDAGETFSIDPDALAKALQKIKWSQVTAKSWLAKEFKIDTKGDLIKDILPNLTREQAEAFIKEVRTRATQQQQMDLGG
jgi:hypothetical protein